MGDWRIELRSRGTIGDTFHNNGKLQHLYLTLINNKGAAVAEIHGAQTDGDLQIKRTFPFMGRSSKLSYYFFGGDSPLYADYALFGHFQWARCISDFELLASDDPIKHWRTRMLNAFDGLALKAPGY
jgi:glutathione S-transferase